MNSPSNYYVTIPPSPKQKQPKFPSFSSLNKISIPKDWLIEEQSKRLLKPRDTLRSLLPFKKELFDIFVASPKSSPASSSNHDILLTGRSPSSRKRSLEDPLSNTPSKRRGLISPHSKNGSALKSRSSQMSLLNFLEEHKDFDDIVLSTPSTLSKEPTVTPKQVDAVEVSDDDVDDESHHQDRSDTPMTSIDQAVRWMERYEELRRFKAIHGHCLVPSSWPENPALSKWIKHQRYQWKLLQEGRQSTLTSERQRHLDTLNFVWEPHRASWERHLEELIKFKSKHGHTNVPARYADDQPLAHWAKYQRRQFKVLCKMGVEASNLNLERILKLIDVGFVFNPSIWRSNAKSANPLPSHVLVAEMVPEELRTKILESTSCTPTVDTCTSLQHTNFMPTAQITPPVASTSQAPETDPLHHLPGVLLYKEGSAQFV